MGHKGQESTQGSFLSGKTPGLRKEVLNPDAAPSGYVTLEESLYLPQTRILSKWQRAWKMATAQQMGSFYYCC